MTEALIAEVSFWANVGTLVALILNVVAIAFAVIQLKAGQRASSAASLISLHESFRQAWLQFTRASNNLEEQHAFADIMNLLEIACASFGDKSFSGKSGSVLESYLCHIFSLIGQSKEAADRLDGMFTTDKTFQNIVLFLKTHRSQIQSLRLPVFDKA